MPITSGSDTGNAEDDRSTSDTGKNGKRISMASLQMCLARCGNQGWDGLDCAGKLFAAVDVRRRADLSLRIVD